jgi:hypothetical protein
MSQNEIQIIHRTRQGKKCDKNVEQPSCSRVQHLNETIQKAVATQEKSINTIPEAVIKPFDVYINRKSKAEMVLVHDGGHVVLLAHHREFTNGNLCQTFSMSKSKFQTLYMRRA